ncbi:MAG: diol dehydratase small subunit [Hyphomicrobium sp.]|uniref:diol dehydratase small subunit n=1 Tax=Hyphomicrobium sp. TaxID=82 RepID=UPI003D0AF6D1
MSNEPLSIADYPLAEKRPELVRGKRGKGLEDLTLDAVVEDRVTLEDLSITAEALGQQAEIARAAGRPTLAQNFERAAELVDVPQETIMRVYELLRPGRAPSKDVLLAAARELGEIYGAKSVAAFVAEAAEVYERRGLFKKRF